MAKRPPEHRQGLVRVLASDASGNAYNELEQVLSELPDYLLRLHERFEWRQMGILVFKNNEGDKVVQTLLNHNKQHAGDPDKMIRVTSDDSLLLNNSTLVRRIIILLRFIDATRYTPDEDEDVYQDLEKQESDQLKDLNKKRKSEQRMLHVLNDFMVKRKPGSTPSDTGALLDQCFMDFGQNEDGKSDEKVNSYLQMLLDLLPSPDTHLLTLTSIVERLIEHVTSEVEPGADGDSPAVSETAFLQGFQNCVVDYASRNSGGTVREFLRYWEQEKDHLTIPTAAGDDAIEVLTIHKAKGLEYDCVIIPFANWELESNGDDNFWIDLEEWKNAGGDTLFDEYCRAHPGTTIDMPPLIPLNRVKCRSISNDCGIFAGKLNNIKSDALIDNVNKTYVALTRPRAELHVFAFSKKRNWVGSMLIDEVPQIAGVRVIDRGWEVGVEEAHECEDPKSSSIAAMPPYYVSPEPGQLQVKLPPDTSARQDQGLQLHYLMSHIRYPGDAAKAIARAKRRGAFDGEWSQQQFEAVVQRLFTDSQTAPWFAADNRVYNERSMVEFIAPEGKTPECVVHRPDRVVRRPDGSYVVVDYKFGDPRPKHQEQVRDYAAQLSRITHAAVQGFLVYLAPSERPKIYSVYP